MGCFCLFRWRHKNNRKSRLGAAKQAEAGFLSTGGHRLNSSGSGTLKFRTKKLKMQYFLRHLIFYFLRKKTNAEIGKFKICLLSAPGQPPGLYHHFRMTFWID